MTKSGSGSVWERSLTLFEMTHGLCSCHSEQSEESFSILRVMVIENEPLPQFSIPCALSSKILLQQERTEVFNVQRYIVGVSPIRSIYTIVIEPVTHVQPQVHEAAPRMFLT